MSLMVILGAVVLGTSEGIKQAQSKGRRDEHRSKKCNLAIQCSKSSQFSSTLDGKKVVLSGDKLYIDTGMHYDAPFGHPFYGCFHTYPGKSYSGVASTISPNPQVMNWIYIDRDTYEVKFGSRPYAEYQYNGPFDCTRQERRLTFGGWEGFFAAQEGEYWALYFDLDNDELKGKIQPGTPILEVELMRKEIRGRRVKKEDREVPEEVEVKPESSTNTETATAEFEAELLSALEKSNRDIMDANSKMQHQQEFTDTETKELETKVEAVPTDVETNTAAAHSITSHNEGITSDSLQSSERVADTEVEPDAEQDISDKETGNIDTVSDSLVVLDTPMLRIKTMVNDRELELQPVGPVEKISEANATEKDFALQDLQQKNSEAGAAIEKLTLAINPARPASQGRLFDSKDEAETHKSHLERNKEFRPTESSFPSAEILSEHEIQAASTYLMTNTHTHQPKSHNPTSQSNTAYKYTTIPSHSSEPQARSQQHSSAVNLRAESLDLRGKRKRAFVRHFWNWIRRSKRN